MTCCPFGEVTVFCHVADEPWLLAQLFEGRIRMSLYMGIVTTQHGPNNPVYNVHRMVVAHYTRGCALRHQRRYFFTKSKSCVL